MGLLSLGSPLSWEETKKYADHVRKHGIEQFLHIYNRLKTRQNDMLKWGDEVEYTLIKFDHENKKAYLNLKAEEFLEILQVEENTNPGNNPTSWKPEYAGYMLEGTPGKPLGGCMRHFNTIEANMKLRREEVNSLLEPDEAVLSIVSFPRLGSPKFTFPEHPVTPGEGVTSSLFYPDQAIFQGHPRFATLSRNIRERRGSKVAINVPIFKDVNTPSPFIEESPEVKGEGASASKPDHIYLDAMGFGMGCSCLQMTFQACSIDEGRHLYDQLAVVTPIVMALSAATPIFRGYLGDIDCRWSVIAGSVDDRRPEELGLEPLKESRFVIPKSRYDSISCYLSPEGAKYNDIELVMDEDIYDQLTKNGIDELLARHYAHLFIRDPMTLFKEHIDEDDTQSSNHFENIQSTNWQTMRFKPPPPNSPIGWRVEFRPTEVQLTDFENAAFVAFVVLLSRVILSFDLNLLIPISKVDENMQTAQKRDAVRQGKFYFRKTLKNCKPQCAGSACCEQPSNTCDDITLMSVDTIINGKEGEFPGLIPLMNSYLSNVDVDIDTRCTISQYLKLIQKRASGELMTTARWMRQFVHDHPSYKKDSVVSEEICYDLMNMCNKIANGEEKCPELIGNHVSKTNNVLDKKCIRIQDEINKMEAEKIKEMGI
ncbi:glutamate--cysteine ligase catalytic subunit-like isoform X2 [Actinia tenebrosa]|uniref:Glutamate--cysteine ligase n=1 Tax=Actinia tenebrosa TaxID=6105 RepID=A0A6P8IV08_ACTTE|nr:glutamate--cysteine ligase catalytic subunit-like isoform X2 [Actinia tenebrosa]